jgi:hypothetical protein
MSELGEEILRYLDGLASPVDSSTLATHFACDHQKVTHLDILVGGE